MRRMWSTFAAAVGVVMLAVPALAQQEDRRPAAEHRRSTSLDGATGLFTVWDAETLKSGELSVGLAVNRYNRDPGQLQITGFPLAGSIGAFGFLELFGALDAQKQITAGSIGLFRVPEGQTPRPATTPLGVRLYSTEAIFMDVPSAAGVGNMRGGVKVNVLSERRDQPFALSGVIFGEIPMRWSDEALKQGLSSHTVRGGFGALVSKRFDDKAQLHFNFRFENIRSPRGRLSRDDLKEKITDVGHEFIFRGGVLLPNRGDLNFIAEVDAKIHAGDRTPGLNPINPFDLLLGLRFHQDRYMALSAGYRFALRRIREDPGQHVFRTDPHGFLVQLALGLRRD